MASFFARLLGHREQQTRTVRERLAALVREIAEGRDDQEPAAVEELLALARWTDETLRDAVEAERERLALEPDAASLPRVREDLSRLQADAASEEVTLRRQTEAIAERREHVREALALAQGRVARAELAAQKLKDTNRRLRALFDPKQLAAEDAAKVATKRATGDLLALEAERRDTESRLEAARARLAELEAQRREAGTRDPSQTERELAAHVEALTAALGRLTQRKRDLEQQRAEAQRTLEPQT